MGHEVPYTAGYFDGIKQVVKLYSRTRSESYSSQEWHFLID